MRSWDWPLLCFALVFFLMGAVLLVLLCATWAVTPFTTAALWKVGAALFQCFGSAAACAWGAWVLRDKRNGPP